MSARVLLAVAVALLVGCSTPEVRRATLYIGNDVLHMGIRGQDIEAGLGAESETRSSDKEQVARIRGLAEEVRRKVPSGTYRFDKHEEGRIEIEVDGLLLVYRLTHSKDEPPVPPELEKLLVELSGLIKW